MVQTQLQAPSDETTQTVSTARAHDWEFGPDPLIELELRVARRADELARSAAARTSLNLRHWLQAEQEILQPLIDSYRSSPRCYSGLALG